LVRGLSIPPSSSLIRFAAAAAAFREIYCNNLFAFNLSEMATERRQVIRIQELNVSDQLLDAEQQLQNHNKSQTLCIAHIYQKKHRNNTSEQLIYLEKLGSCAAMVPKLPEGTLVAQERF
jgi:hypothetical protein